MDMRLGSYTGPMNLTGKFVLSILRGERLRIWLTEARYAVTHFNPLKMPESY